MEKQLTNIFDIKDNFYENKFQSEEKKLMGKK